MLLNGNEQIAVQLMSLKTRTFIETNSGSYIEELGDETKFSLKQIKKLRKAGIEVSILDSSEKDVTDTLLRSLVGSGNEKFKT